MPKQAESFYLEGTNGKAVLLCHTLAGEPSQMRELGNILHQKGYTVSCPLYRGHGTKFSDLIKTDALMWYEDVLNEFDKLHKSYDTIYVVGMSIGGSFSIKLAEERPVSGVCTVNAPIIGFDIKTDVEGFQAQYNNNDVTINKYRQHRMKYFDFVVELGQTDKLQTITCPMFTLQGSLDGDRYKISTMLLQQYTSSTIKQRIDYANSEHLLLLGPDKEQAIKDIVEFIQQN